MFNRRIDTHKKILEIDANTQVIYFVDDKRISEIQLQVAEKKVSNNTRLLSLTEHQFDKVLFHLHPGARFESPTLNKLKLKNLWAPPAIKGENLGKILNA